MARQAQHPHLHALPAYFALGAIAADGSRRTASQRIRIQNDFIVIDGSAVFSFERRDPTNCDGEWVRLPGVIQSVAPECAGLFRCAVQTRNPLCWADLNTGAEAYVGEDSRAKAAMPICSSNSALESQAATIEELLCAGSHDAAYPLLIDALSGSPEHPRLLYAKGAAHIQRSEPEQAKACFHGAMWHGHPDGFDAELYATSLIAKTLRDKYPETFQHIQRGEGARALTILRAIRSEEPLHANAALAYCLRSTQQPEEGIDACMTALSLDRYQSDVYGHLWAFYTQLGRDTEALSVATEHIMHYPFHAPAYMDALDSCLLLGRIEEAGWYARMYLTLAVNLHAALKNLFKYFEATRDWETGLHYFDSIVACLRAPTPETLTLHGELLTEMAQFERAEQKLERAVEADPGSVEAILAYARSQARAGNESAAIKFLQTVLKDPSRVDVVEQQMLLVSLLSELLRNTDQLDEAAALWPAAELFDGTLLKRVGPRPVMEAACCYFERGERDAARQLARLAEAEFPQEFVVKHYLAAFD